MKALFYVVVVLLLLGPLRRRCLFAFFAAWWRTVVPLVVGWAVGILIVARLMPGAPPYMMILGPVMAAFVVGGGVRELLNEVFPPKGK